METSANRVESFNNMVRGLVTLGMVAAFIFMSIRHVDVPEGFLVTLGTVVTFWFTSRDQKAAVAAGVAAVVAAKNGKDGKDGTTSTASTPPVTS